MKHTSYFALQVADYDMTDAEMMKLLDGFLSDTKPLYEKLHAWVRETLAARYKQPVPKLIPAHWIDNRWSQEWSGVVEGSLDMDPLFKSQERASGSSRPPSSSMSRWVSLAAATFWQKLGHVSGAAGRQTPQERARLVLAHRSRQRHPLAHERPAQHLVVPHRAPRARPRLLLHQLLAPRGAADSASGRQSRHARGDRRSGGDRGVAAACTSSRWACSPSHQDRRARRAARRGAGVGHPVHGVVGGHHGALGARPLRQGHARRASGRSAGGTTSPSSRAWRRRPIARTLPDACDACSKTHINDLPAQYYNYALSTVIKYQLHDHICKKILKQDPHSCSYYGHKEVGDFLQEDLVAGRDPAVARHSQGGHRRAALDARADGLFQAARCLARRAAQGQARRLVSYFFPPAFLQVSSPIDIHLPSGPCDSIALVNSVSLFFVMV